MYVHLASEICLCVCLCVCEYVCVCGDLCESGCLICAFDLCRYGILRGQCMYTWHLKYACVCVCVCVSMCVCVGNCVRVAVLSVPLTCVDMEFCGANVCTPGI